MPFLTASPIAIADLTSGIPASEQGALVTFSGLVRDANLGRRVTGLEYSAYNEMAESVCGEILEEAHRTWPVSVRLQHRIGQLRIGEIAVIVVVAGAHRGESFEACRYIIEQLKRRVPIWKREHYTDGDSGWVANAE